jgi:hypothetical protein
MKQIIQNIQDRLAQEVPTLKYVDQDWGQMDFFPNPPVKYPCALIDIQSAQYTNNGNFIQQGTAIVIIRLFELKLSNSSQAASTGQKENAKKIWQLIEDVNKAVHGQNFLQEGYGLPIREQMRRTKRNDGCYQTELYYSVQFTDTTCQSKLMPVSPVIPNVKTVGLKKT